MVELLLLFLLWRLSDIYINLKLSAQPRWSRRDKLRHLTAGAFWSADKGVPRSNVQGRAHHLAHQVAHHLAHNLAIDWYKIYDHVLCLPTPIKPELSVCLQNPFLNVLTSQSSIDEWFHPFLEGKQRVLRIISLWKVVSWFCIIGQNTSFLYKMLFWI